jgi:hypothetical protein
VACTSLQVLLEGRGRFRCIAAHRKRYRLLESMARMRAEPRMQKA